jgi:glycerol-3-phosphate O-acyltransferase
VLHNLLLMVRSEWRRFGYACVNFGSPLSMRDYCGKRASTSKAQRRCAKNRRWRRSVAK